MSLVFYHGHGSPYSWRVFLALEHLGVPYELKVLSFSEKDQLKPEFVAINPRHQVPTITDDGFALWESTVILEYLDERYGGEVPNRRLYPGDAKARARTRRLVRETEEYAGGEGMDPIVVELFFSGDKVPDATRVDKGRRWLADEMKAMAGELRGAFFCGDQPTAADFVFYPLYGYMKRVTFRKPETKLTELVPPAIAQWAARIEALPYFDKTFPPHWR